MSNYRRTKRLWHQSILLDEPGGAQVKQARAEPRNQTVQRPGVVLRWRRGVLPWKRDLSQSGKVPVVLHSMSRRGSSNFERFNHQTKNTFRYFSLTEDKVSWVEKSWY